jgi:hypothetical protein
MDSGFLLFKDISFRSSSTNLFGAIQGDFRDQNRAPRIEAKPFDNQVVQILNILIEWWQKINFQPLNRMLYGDRIRILFVVKESRTNSKGLFPIYMRVTANGQRFESSIARSVDFTTWSQSAGKMIGNTKGAKELNDFLNVLRRTRKKSVQTDLCTEKIRIFVYK